MNTDANLIGQIDRDAWIYRIFLQDRFFELFETRENALVSPGKWQDPFENVFLNAPVRTASGETGRFSFHGDVYGQCWTLHKASDAMWQIYSGKKNGIRVRTTVGKLIDSLCTAKGKWAHATCFIGRVQYLSDRKLKEFGQTVFKDGVTPTAIARSLLVKRKAYEHEREVRLVYMDPETIQHQDGVYKYPIQPLDLIEQAMIDGRFDGNYPNFKDQIMKRTGLSGEQVKRSLLYRQPDGFVVEIP